MTVIKKIDTPEYINNKKAHIYWLCKCNCGNEKIVHGGNLKNNQVISCGCYQKEMSSLPYGESNLNRLFKNYEHHAKNRNLSFELTRDEFSKLTKQKCSYCGKPPLQEKKGTRTNGVYIYNGIDRIDSSIGYIKNNVVSCCGQCNKAKLNYSEKDFLEWVGRVYNYRLKEIK